MSEITKGTQVQVTLTGRYDHGLHDGHWIYVDGVPRFLPATAEIEVILPPPPPDGSYVEVRSEDAPTAEVWRKLAGMKLYAQVGSGPDETARTWAELHQRGTVTVLTPAGETPRYEQATRGGMVLWQHGCGSVTACGPSEDPGADGIDCEDGCQTPTARWTRLYRGVRTDG